MGVDPTVISRPPRWAVPPQRSAQPRWRTSTWSVRALLVGASALLCQACSSGAERRPEDGPDLVLPVMSAGFGVALGVVGGVLLAQVPEREASVDRLKAEGASKKEVQRAEIEVIQAQSYGALGVITGGVLVGLALVFVLVEPPPEPPAPPPDPFGPYHPANPYGHAAPRSQRVPAKPSVRDGVATPARPAPQLEANPTGFTLRF